MKSNELTPYSFQCRYGRVDILVNNASKQLMCSDFSQIDLGDVQSTFQSNIIQMFAITKFAVPYMKKGSSYVLLLPTNRIYISYPILTQMILT